MEHAKKSITLEVCVDSVEGAIAAQEGGAHRMSFARAFSTGSRDEAISRGGDGVSCTLVMCDSSRTAGDR